MLMGTESRSGSSFPALAAGEKLAAFCLSEPEVGSDAANVQTTARAERGWHALILNGEKKFATNAAIAGMMTVMAQTPVDRKWQDAGESDGVHRDAGPARLRGRQAQPQQVRRPRLVAGGAAVQRHARARAIACWASSARD